MDDDEAAITVFEEMANRFRNDKDPEVRKWVDSAKKRLEEMKRAE